MHPRGGHDIFPPRVRARGNGIGAMAMAGINYAVTDNWGSGFVGSMTVPGGTQGLHGWTVEFDASFARLDWISRNRFDIQWHRHTGQWFRLHRGLNLADAIETLRLDGLLHPP